MKRDRLLVLLLASVLLQGCSVVCMMKPHHHETMTATAPKDFQEAPPFQGRTVYVRGAGEPVILLHELPGQTPQFFELARRLSRTHRVYAPILFGRWEKRSSGVSLVARCASDDYNCVASKLSGVTGWVGAFADSIHAADPSQPVHVIGMCLTGNIPLGLLDRPFVKRVVLSQPSLPVAVGGLTKSLGMSEAEEGIAPASQARLLLLRFCNDCISPSARAEAYQHFFGDRLTVVQYPGDEQYHAVLTDSLGHAGGDAVIALVTRFLAGDVVGSQNPCAAAGRTVHH